MNKTHKRQLNIKNKLIAAIAMLLVSSIMMVSSTYAWFTLSTAPEVQGITTTVDANGNLEIALSPADGDYNKITSNVGDANEEDWTKKNLTWGNLIDLSDASYRLNELTLLPSQLYINPGSATAPATLADNPLKIPVYGADGRISALDGTKVFLGGYDTVGDASGFMAGRAINLCRFGTQGAGYIHDRRDNLRSGYLDEKSLDITLQQALMLSKHVVNAKVFPIERKISDEIRGKVDEYLFKEKK